MAKIRFKSGRVLETERNALRIPKEGEEPTEIKLYEEGSAPVPYEVEEKIRAVLEDIEDDPKTCPICGKKFKTARGCKTHIRMKHGGN